jgi:uncharacterized protein YsxB (DUF464 family)
MISAAFITDAEMLEVYLKVKGHAGMAEIGHDIICAAASILAYTYAAVVDDMRHDLDCEPIIDLAYGNTTVACRCKDTIIYKKVLDALHYTKVGYMLLAREHPRFVELTTVGEDI